MRKLNRVLRNAHVQVDVPFTLPLADADYTLLDQVLTNLLENAARHSPEGGVIRVRAREQGDWIEVSVADQGPASCRTTSERIFEPFSRGEELDLERRGSRDLPGDRFEAQAAGSDLRCTVERGRGGGAPQGFDCSRCRCTGHETS